MKVREFPEIVRTPGKTNGYDSAGSDHYFLMKIVIRKLKKSKTLVHEDMFVFNVSLLFVEVLLKFDQVFTSFRKL